MRPGRLDRKIYVPLPDKTTRFEILRLKLSKMPTSDDVDINKLVELTENYSGAEVRLIFLYACITVFLQRNTLF